MLNTFSFFLSLFIYTRQQNKKRNDAINQFPIKLIRINKMLWIPFRRYAIVFDHTFKQGAKTVLQKIAIN